jgi:hypothetical protein
MFFLMLTLVCLLLLLVTASGALFSIFLNAPWVPLSYKKIDKMLEMADLRPYELIVDLGSGDGRVLMRAVKHFGALGRGVELNPVMAWFSRLDLFLRGLGPRVEIKRQNMFEADITKADVVALYLFPKANKALESKIMNEIKPGCRVVSYAFSFPNWQPTKKQLYGPGYIYLYIKDW